MAVNPNEAPDGYEARPSLTSIGCAFDVVLRTVISRCHVLLQKYVEDAIFVKKPAPDSSPAQITWPRDSEGREVQE